MLGMLTHVHLRRERPIGCTKQIDALVPQRGADVVKVIHSYGSGVQAQVGNFLQLLPATAHFVLGKYLAEEGRQIPGVVTYVAMEGVGAAGSPLVHEDQIVIVSDGLKYPSA